MANIERGEVEMIVNDTPYTLKLSTNAAVALETRLKQGFGDILSKMEALDVTAIRDVAWVTLQKYHADKFKTPAQVGDFIDEAGGVGVFLDAFRRLAAANTPEGMSANPPAALTSGTGDSSTETVAA